MRRHERQEERVMEQLTKFIGLDVHKDTIAVAVAEDGADRTVRFFGTIPNTPEAVRRLVARLRGPEIELRFTGSE
jgi:transposase